MYIYLSIYLSIYLYTHIYRYRSSCAKQQDEAAPACASDLVYRGTSPIRKRTPLGPYRRPMPRFLGEWAFSHGRGTPVAFSVQRSELIV